jgi:hypothetical protein
MFLLPLYADEGHVEDTPADQKAAPVSKDDIWQEVSFESEQDVDLDDPRIQRMLEEIRHSDPQKAEQMEKLRGEDPKKYAELIRIEIRNALKPKAKPDNASGPESEKPSEWQEQLQKRHEYFMEWFSREYAVDYTELVKIRDTDAEKYVQRVMDMMTIYEPIQRAQRYNPPLADVMKQDIELQKQRDALLLQIRKAVAEEQTRLLKELEALVAARFDIIVQKKELQYESLRRRLDKLEVQLDQQALDLENLKKNKAQTVEDHIRELMSRTEKITW